LNTKTCRVFFVEGTTSCTGGMGKKITVDCRVADIWELHWSALTHFGGINVIPCRQHPNYGIVPTLGTRLECSAVDGARCVTVDIVPFLQHPRHPLILNQGIYNSDV